MGTHRAIGLLLGSSVAPGRLAEATRAAEEGGFDEVWLAEDFFFTGGVSGASIALGATESITVGLGVVSAVVRHPALLAMEISTISGAYPGRLIAGVGLGVPAWIRQMGLHPKSPMAVMRACVSSVRSLLRGAELTTGDGPFHFDRVQLTYPESGEPTPVHMGVTGPNMLRLSGEIADGSVLSVTAGDEYVRWARQRIDEGRLRAGRAGPHRVTVFALYSVDEDGEVARNIARAPLAFYRSMGVNALSDVYGISDELRRLIDEGGYEAVLAGMPDRWIEDLTVAGTPQQVAAKIRALYDSGADSVALFPLPSDEVDRVIALTVSEVLPVLSG